MVLAVSGEEVWMGRMWGGFVWDVLSFDRA